MSEDLAKRRLLTLNLVRLSGLGIAMFGMLVMFGKFDLPAWSGYLIFVVGMIEMLIAPPLLARGWKSPPQ